ncbi:hypothetical protein CR513_01301, partial [Mucuna pruriens]
MLFLPLDPWNCYILICLGLLYFANVFKMKKVLILLLPKVIMGDNLKMKTFNRFVKNMEFITIFSLQELLSIMTPYELWKGRQLNISYFHPLGCDCFILNNKDNFESIHVKFNDSKPNKELSELIEPFVELNIKELQTLSNELLVDDKPKIDEAETSSRN